MKNKFVNSILLSLLLLNKKKIILSFLLFLFTNLKSQTIASNTNNFSPYNDIQDAINNASNSHTIVVFEGTHNGDYWINKTNINIISWPYLQSNDSTAVVLNGQGAGTVAYLEDSANVTIRGFTISNATNAIGIDASSISNTIANNIVADMSGDGISVWDEASDGNVITHNTIFGPNTENGIYILEADNTRIASNIVYNCNYGIDFEFSAANNVIISNTIYSNDLMGIIFWSEGCDDNTIENNIIWGDNQDSGINISGGDNNKVINNTVFGQSGQGIGLSATACTNVIRDNTIYNCQDGIILDDDSRSNMVINNDLCSNTTGIGISGTGVFNNSIVSNRICSNGSWGITINESRDLLIARNLFDRNGINGIYAGTSASNVEVINNTFVYTISDNACYLDTGAKNFFFYNNIFMSNFGYGVENTTANLMVLGYNIFWENNWGVTIGPKTEVGTNYMADPVIASTYPYNILNGTSPAVDNGTNYPAPEITNGMQGSGVDIGWLESPYYGVIAASNTNNSSTYTNIQSAIDTASNGHTVVVYDGIYNDGIIINKKTNFCLISLSFLTNNDNTKVIIEPPAASNGFTLDDSLNVTIQGFTIRNGTNGIRVTGTSWSNTIANNRIYSNDINGIGLSDEFNIIISNDIWGKNQNNGIYGWGPDNNTICYNSIHDHSSTGIYFEEGATNNLISSNSIYSNGWIGIGLAYWTIDCDNNKIISNNFWGTNQQNAIWIDQGDYNLIEGNLIHNHQYNGIYLESDGGTALSNIISGNFIYSNANNGIYIRTNFVIGTEIRSNEIWGPGQNYGIYDRFGENTRIYRNLIRDNQQKAIEFNIGAVAFEVYNNTILRNVDGDGISIKGTSAGNIYNNIILSNGSGSTDYGIDYEATAGVVNADYNLIQGVSTRLTNDAGGGTVNWGGNNVYGQDPLIKYTDPYDITNANSAAVDSGTNIAGVSDVWKCFAPDMGWIESPYYGSAAASNTNTGTNYQTIQAAINEAGDGHTIVVFDGTYSNNLQITNKTNLNIIAYSYFTGDINTNAILNINDLANGTNVTIKNSYNIMLRGFTVIRGKYGVFLLGNAASNTLANNIIYSNEYAGIIIDSDTADNNNIVSNVIWENSYGIIVDQAENIVIESNYIHHNRTNGIYLYDCGHTMIRQNVIHDHIEGIILDYDSISNDIHQNTIYSNSWSGIFLQVENNNIMSNEIWACDYAAIDMEYSSYNLVLSNRIHNNDCGIRFPDAGTNTIINNYVYSNNNFGIGCTWGDPVGNVILSNVVYGNQQEGINIYGGISNAIHRNLIYKNQDFGIRLYGASVGAQIINNTIFGNVTLDGIKFEDSSSGVIYNNIIMDNGDNSDEFGIENSGNGTITVAYNDIYDNYDGPTNNSGGGTLIWGPGNTFNDPLIETIIPFAITNEDSPAVDTGTNIPGVTDIISGLGPDMGWIESDYSSAVVASNTNTSTKHRTIQAAIDAASNGHTVVVFDGTYTNDLDINDKTDFSLIAWSWITNSNNTTAVLTGANRIIEIDDSINVTVQGFSICNSSDRGVNITGNSSSNKILNNLIYSNALYGVYLDDGDYTLISSNTIFGGNQNNAIRKAWGPHDNTIIYNTIKFHDNNAIHLYSRYNDFVAYNNIYSNAGTAIYIDATNCFIVSNSIWGNGGIGIDFSGRNNFAISNSIRLNQGDGIEFSSYSTITHNEIFSNGDDGIYTYGGDYCFIASNHIWGSQNDGIDLNYNAYFNTIISNTIELNGSRGIDVDRSGNDIINNKILSNGTYGIYLSGSSVFSNTIVSNIIQGPDQDYGIRFRSGAHHNTVMLNTVIDNVISCVRLSEASNNTIMLNNIFGQVTGIDYESGTNNTFYSNYFGSFNLTKVIQTNNNITSNMIIPYRLGEIGIAQGDLIQSPVPTNLSISTNGSSLVIDWDNTVDGTAGYRIYRSVNADTWTNFFSYKATTVSVFTDYIPAAGTNYYFVTSYDNATPYENESWWSSESVSGALYFTVVASNIITGAGYSNIQNAIDDAADNETVVVFDGTYTNDLVITKTNFSLIALSWVTNGDNTAVIFTGNDRIFDFDESINVAIQGFSLEGASNSVYMSGTCYSNRLLNNRVYSNKDAGIYLDGGGYHTIASNMIWSNQGHGMTFMSPQNNVVLSNTIKLNAGFAVWFYSSEYNTVVNNHMYSNGSTGIRLASSDNTIISNTIWGMNQSYGIRCSDGANSNRFIRNTIKLNGGPGISLSLSNNVVVQNEIFSNTSYGIELTDYNLIASNHIWGLNQDSGIYGADGAHDNTIFSNIIERNQFYGISLRESSNNVIMNNKIFSNQSYGIYLYNIDAAGNTIASNSIHGINQDYGICFEGSAHDNLILLNTMTSNEVGGIYLDTANNNVCAINNIFGQGKGIDYASGSGNTFYSNWFGSINQAEVIATNTGVTSDYFPYRLGFVGIHQDDTSSPPVPSFSSANNTRDGVYLTWDDVGVGAIGYRIYRSFTNTWTNFFTYYEDVGNVYSWLDTNASAAETTYYFITSYDSALPYENESWFSTSASGMKSMIGTKAYTFPTNSGNKIWAFISNEMAADPIPATDPDLLTNLPAFTTKGLEVSNDGIHLTNITVDKINWNCSLFKFKINENSNDILSIKASWMGSRGANTASQEVFIWDQAANLWDVFGTGIPQTPDTMYSTNITTNPKNFFRTSGADTFLYILSRFNSPTAGGTTDRFILNDYIEVSISNTNFIPPDINNTIGAVNVSMTNALLSGNLVTDGSIDTRIYIYYGTNDGGIIKSNWGKVIYMGLPGIGAFQTNAGNLFPGTTYYYRCYASNSIFITNWAPISKSFFTIPLVASNTNTGGRYTNIQSAVDAAGEGHVVFVFDGNYNESVSVIKTNMVIAAKSWVEGGDNTKAVINASNKPYGFYLDNARNVTIQGFSILNAVSGIYLANTSVSNNILSNVIYSNSSYGICLYHDNADYNKAAWNDIWGANQNRGIYFRYADNNTICSNKIHNNSEYGIYFSSVSTAQTNTIIGNNIYSNLSAGIHLETDNTRYNRFISNNIYGPDQEYGISIDDSDYNIITNNYIHNNDICGIFFDYGTAQFNKIINNNIYSNDNYGIRIGGTSPRSNDIYSNTIYGPDQNDGIYSSGSGHVISNNIIRNNDDTGITLTDPYNSIVNNFIYSNNNEGILLTEVNAKYIIIKNNEIYANSSGIRCEYGSSNEFTRNLLRDNTSHGIYIRDDATDIKIFNNTIVSNDGNGVYFRHVSYGEMYNNIIFSNSGYGINYIGTHASGVKVDYNLFYSNTAGLTNTNTTLIFWGNNNTNDGAPLLDANYEIITNTSPAVDRGTNIPGVSDVYDGAAPDMGWKESPFTNVLAYAASNTNMGIEYPTVQSAINAVSNGHTIVVYEGVHNGPLTLYGKTNMTVMSLGWLLSNDNTSTVIDGIYRETAVMVSNADRVTLEGFTILGGTNQVYIIDAERCAVFNTVTSNQLGFDDCGICSETSIRTEIASNGIYGGGRHGIELYGATSNVIHNNDVRVDANYALEITYCSYAFITNNTFRAVYRSVSIESSDNIIMHSNNIFNDPLYLRNISDSTFTSNAIHDGSGIACEDSTVSNTFAVNKIYDCAKGIYIWDDAVEYNSFFSNDICSNSESGIFISNAHHNTFFSNNIYSNGQNGVYIGINASNNNVICNNIYSNDISGIYIESDTAMYNDIGTNSIWGGNQDHGVCISNAGNNAIEFNKIHNNQKQGIRITGSGSGNTVIINNVYDQDTGIEISGTSFSNRIYRNAITNNNNAGVLMEGTAAMNDIYFNNIYLQIVNISNVSGGNTFLSNWFGSMTLSNVAKSIYGTNTNAYVPYRLGLIGITQGDVIPPIVPTNLSVSYDAATVILDWDSSGGDAEGYRIYRSIYADTWTNFSAYYTNISGVSNTIFTDNTIQVGTNYYYFITAYDGAVPLENESWWSASIGALVEVYPVVAITNPNANTWLTNSTCTVSGSASNEFGEITGVWFSTNGIVWGLAGGTTNWSTNVTLIDNKTNYFYVKASNEYGTVTDIIQTNYVDTTAPITAITNPQAGDAISNTVTYAGTNYDSFADITGVWYSTNGGSSWFAPADTNVTWFTNIDTRPFSNVQFVFGIKSSNEAGLVRYDYVTNYISNNILPTIAITNPIDNTWLTNTNVSFSGWASNEIGELTGVYFSISNTGFGLVQGTTNWITNTVDISALADSTNVFYVIASNERGYVRTNTLTNMIDFTPPDILFAFDYHNNVFRSITNIKGSADDPFSPVDCVDLTLRSNGVFVDSFTISLSGTNWGTNINTGKYYDGIYDLILSATNQAGLLNVITQTNVTFSNFPGAVIVTSPPNYGYITGITVITGYIQV
ncbi:right-handed parallel beta-helix repeat-containing protein, partial [Spirochaetota bacterium]